MNRQCHFLIFILKTLALLININAIITGTDLYSLPMNNDRAKREFSNSFTVRVFTHDF